MLKQFLKGQTYFQELERNNDIGKILDDLSNEMEIKLFNKNEFLFHYDNNDFFDWFIILKGKVSVFS